MFGRSASQLVLRYLKYRWIRDTADLLLETVEGGDEAPLAFDDFDLDNDVVELFKSAGREATRQVALGVLGLEAPLPEDSPALTALAPDMSPPVGRAFLALAAGNLAFRLRDDELLRALARHTAHGPAPRLTPERLGNLLGRSRPQHRAQALLEESGLTGRALAAAQAAVTAVSSVTLSGSRAFVDAGHPELELGLERVFPDKMRVDFGHPFPDTRRFLLMRRRGGFTTLLEAEDALPLELCQSLARIQGIGRVIWSGADELKVLEGSRTLASHTLLSPADLVGELRALGVLDLDPQHPRGQPPLQFEAAYRLRKKGIRPLAFGVL